MTPVDHFLPSRNIACDYCMAMHFAQEFEENLRAFLYVANYHAWVPEICFSKEELKRFKDFDGFLDKATCGLLLQKIREISGIKSKKLWATFNRACEYRNTLAHSFLASQDFHDQSLSAEAKIIQKIRKMTADIYYAVIASRVIRKHFEKLADRSEESLKQTMKELVGIEDYKDLKRKYEKGVRVQKLTELRNLRSLFIAWSMRRTVKAK